MAKHICSECGHPEDKHGWGLAGDEDQNTYYIGYCGVQGCKCKGFESKENK